MKQIAFKLEVFEGPLDLLLHLISKNKVEITDIPISLITEQYLEYLSQMEKIDMEISSDFLVMASTLIYIKSKILLPAENEEEDEDPRDELAKRLLEYKRIKMATAKLREKETEGSFFFYKPADYIEPTIIDETFKRITVDSLYSAINDIYSGLVRKKPPSISNFKGIVGREIVPVFKKLKSLWTNICKKKNVKFNELLKGVKTRDEAVASFLAILELLKMNRIKINGTHESDMEINYVRKGNSDIIGETDGTSYN